MKIGITIAIYINNEDHLDFTKQTIESINTSHDYNVVLVENFVSDVFRKEYDDYISHKNSFSGHEFISLKNESGNIVGAAWNQGIKKCFELGNEIVLVPNNDIIMHPDAIDNLVKFIKQTKDEFILWTAMPYDNLRNIYSASYTFDYDDHPGFSFFAVTNKSINKLMVAERDTEEPIKGYFDPNFNPAYFEDLDMATRIIKYGFKAGKTASALYYHFGSRTIKVDQELNLKNFTTYEQCRRYFENKWGIDAHGKPLSNEDLKNLTHKTPFNK